MRNLIITLKVVSTWKITLKISNAQWLKWSKAHLAAGMKITDRLYSIFYNKPGVPSLHLYVQRAYLPLSIKVDVVVSLLLTTKSVGNFTAMFISNSLRLSYTLKDSISPPPLSGRAARSLKVEIFATFGCYLKAEPFANLFAKFEYQTISFPGLM